MYFFKRTFPYSDSCYNLSSVALVTQSLAKAAVMSKEGNRLDPSEIKVVAKTENAKNYLEKYKTKPARPESKEEAA